ncbi:MAG: phosphate ABC transporter permease PstA [Pseudobdellovibrio sp.]
MKNQHVEYLKRQDSIFWFIGLITMAFAMITLFSLVVDMAITGWPRITAEFFTSFPSRFPEKAGILSAWVGSLCVVFVTAIISIPIGVASGIYLEEYAAKNIFTKVIEINILNLAAIPSITFGLMALGIFVYKMDLGQTIITAGLTLGLLILPIIIVTTREAIRTIPAHIREASYSLGATKWQTIWNHILPYSSGGVMTGVVIALSRAIGETAPLITVGALTFIAFLPSSPIIEHVPYISMKWLSDPYTVMPIQMFNWVSRPQEEFHVNAAAAGLVLLTMTLVLNAAAIYIRYRFRRKYKW